MQSNTKSMDHQKLLLFYKKHVSQQLLPFWKNAVDHEHGGLYTCYNNDGSKLVSKDKYTWSQGRAIWFWSKTADMCARGIIDGDGEEYLRLAKKTVQFLKKHVLLENGHCAYLLSEQGEPKESIEGAGLDCSIYADCFVVLGMAEYIRVTHDATTLEFTLNLYDSITKRIISGHYKSEPYPIPEGFTNFAIPMMMLNISQELANALEQMAHPRSREIRGISRHYLRVLTEDFARENYITANIYANDEHMNDTLLTRHICPGHVLEGMWFVLKEAGNLDQTSEFSQKQIIDKVIPAIKYAFQTGWDQEYGGLLRFTNRQGGPPEGRTLNTRTDSLIENTWDTKIWWPHSEGLYCLLLAYHQSGDSELPALYHKLHQYTFDTFPNPNKEVGEWIQIRDREGQPIDKVVALPVKDPFHVLRSFLLIIELLNKKVQ